MTNDNQHIPSGFKPSPLGIIPEDWEVKRLGELGSFKNGLNFTPNEDGFSYYFLGVGDFQDKTDIHANELSQIRLANELDKDYHLKDDDLVFVRSNGSKSLVGRCVIIHADHVKATYSGFCIRFRTISEGTSTRYIKHIIDAGYLQRFLQYEGRGTNITNLNQKILGRLTFPLPNLKEQQNILNVLSLWDTAIEKQSALIEQFTLRKRGLMQQLLTGKKRLKGFSGEWKEVRLGEIAKLVGGGTPTTKNTDYWNGKILWISSSDLKEDDLSVSGTRFITEEAIANSATQLLPTKSILIVTRVGVGKVAIAEQPTCVSQDFTCLTKYDAETNFLAYYLLQIMKEKKNQSQGTSIKGISVDEISKTRIYLPTKKEQTAIASVLVNADQEIEIQKQKLTAMQAQKKGLMQVLLTGKRRIFNEG